MVSVRILSTAYWEKAVEDMHSGNVTNHISQWYDLTSDPEILDTVSGLTIELVDDLTSPQHVHQYPFSTKEHEFVKGEIQRLLALRAVVLSEHEPGEHVSPIFVRPKDDGTYRLILNLKKLNRATEYIHFKMDTLESILCLITPGAYMAKIDIKDAYYSVGIKEDDQKKLKFKFDGNLYQFTVLPNGYSPGPRKFTKLLKPALSELRLNRVTLAAYLDDLFTLNKSINGCRRNILLICKMMQELGFVIHPHKTTFIPSTTLEYLGFIIDTIAMTVSLPLSKKEVIIDLAKEILRESCVTIRLIARLLGLFTSSFIAVSYGPLHYRNIERDKTKALAKHKGDYDKHMSLSHNSKTEITWWIQNVMGASKPIFRPNPHLVITTDACLTGWGACRDGERTGGLFLDSGEDTSINVLEARAVLFGLQSLCDNESNIHIKILSDNSPTVGALNNMGSSRYPDFDLEIRNIWDWAIDRGIWLSSSHIPGKLNVEADEESRKSEARLEWKLEETLFQEIIVYLDFYPEVDLFASRINKQLDRFYAYRPDPEAEVIDAFSVSWTDLKFYAFPPFNCVQRVLQKVRHDQAEGIILVPNWATQIWFHMLTDMTVAFLILPPRSSMLYLPNDRSMQHPLRENLSLRACLISGRR